MVRKTIDPRWVWPVLQALTSNGEQGKDLECFLLLLNRADERQSAWQDTIPSRHGIGAYPWLR
jgi:hypothetical protein